MSKLQVRFTLIIIEFYYAVTRILFTVNLSFPDLATYYSPGFFFEKVKP